MSSDLLQNETYLPVYLAETLIHQHPLPTIPLLPTTTAMSQFLLHPLSPNSFKRSQTPELMYPLSPIPFMASPEPLTYSIVNTPEPWAILSCQPTPPLPPPTFELMEYQLHHPLPRRASPNRLRALTNLGGGQLEIMVRELVRNPDGSMDKIYPWD